MNEPHDPGHPLGHEIDDSQNPTTVSPADGGNAERGDAAAHEASQQESASARRQREMVRQLQDMIDNVAREARPVMREFAAKSAELAALAAQRAGPLAAKAAEKTQVYGDRFAARSKEKAAELRRQREADEAARGGTAAPAGEGSWTEPGEGEPR